MSALALRDVGFMTAGFSWAADFVREQLGTIQDRLLDSVSLGRGLRMAQHDLLEVYRDCSQPGWDGYSAEPVREETFWSAYRFLAAMPPDIPMPTFGAEADGHLTLEWYRTPSRLLSISMSPEGDLYYAALLGGGRRRSGAELFVSDVPEDVLRTIRRLIS